MFPTPKNTNPAPYTFGRLAKPQIYDLVSYTFGSIMMSVSKGEYRYGMNTQEKDNEIYGEGNSYSAEYWQYDARLGRRWNVDPVVKVHESPYATFANNPIWFVDPSGADTSHASTESADFINNIMTKEYEVEKTGLSLVFSKMLKQSVTKMVENPDYNADMAKIIQRAIEKQTVNVKFTNNKKDAYSDIPDNADGALSLFSNKPVVYWNSSSDINSIGISPLFEELIHLEGYLDEGLNNWSMLEDGNWTISKENLLIEESRAKFKVVNLIDSKGNLLVKEETFRFGLYRDNDKNMSFGAFVKTSYGPMAGMSQLQIQTFISTNKGATYEVQTIHHYPSAIPGDSDVINSQIKGKKMSFPYSQEGMY